MQKKNCYDGTWKAELWPSAMGSLGFCNGLIENTLGAVFVLVLDWVLCASLEEGQHALPPKVFLGVQISFCHITNRSKKVVPLTA